MAKKKKQKNDKKIKKYSISIGVILLVTVALFQWGVVGVILNRMIQFLFGKYSWVVCLVALGSVAIILFDKEEHRKTKLVVALASLVSALVLWSALETYDNLLGWEVIKSFFDNASQFMKLDEAVPVSGGLFGAILYALTSLLIAKEGTMILIGCLIVLSVLLIATLDFFQDVWISVSEFMKKPKQWLEQIQEVDTDDVEETIEEVFESEDDKIEDDVMVKEKESFSVIREFEEPKKSSLFMDIDDIGYGSSAEEKIDEKPSQTPTLASKTATTTVTKEKQGPYRLPELSLLDSVKEPTRNDKNRIAAKEKGENLIRILANFGIQAELLATHIGPAVTKFELKPDASIKVNKILGISDNIKMELAARDIRIEAPIPGRNAVGIEIPNVESTAVRMTSLLRSIPAELKSKKTLIALGKDLLGQSVYCDMHKMPHLLIAGATGSGKSVCMNTIITSLLMRTKPDEVKLLLIDPKKVEFTPYRNIPHLIAPVISDAAEASKALKVAVQIMEERYDAFSTASVRNIDGFNQKVEQYPQENMKPMPYIIIIIDELADLMAIAGKDVEMSIQRITQLARAAGIHLIVATQRPSTDVITGIIKANVPSRIAFSVSSGIDSRTILDSVGAERLLGNGDMLYQPIGASSALRLQGAYVSDEEVRKITEFCAKQATPIYEDKLLVLDGVEGNSETAIVAAVDDPLYQEVKDYVVEVQKASTSLIQRRFGFGYNRAARMIDLLEEQGVIGEARGSKPREVYMRKEVDE
ncbi:MAG: DNA translocase FtsK [Anaerorhabdus sp.]